jgi:hypothetical protein
MLFSPCGPHAPQSNHDAFVSGELEVVLKLLFFVGAVLFQGHAEELLELVSAVDEVDAAG